MLPLTFSVQVLGNATGIVRGLEQKVTGNKIAWKAKCTEKGSVTESGGEILYSGTTYSGNQRTKITEKNGQVMNSTAKMKGRRIGECN